MLINLRHIKTCLTVIVMSLCGISVSPPAYSMQSPLKKSGKQEERGYEGLRSSIKREYVAMDEKTAKANILVYLANHHINEKNFSTAIQIYLDNLIKLPQTRPFIEANSDELFHQNIIKAFLTELMKGKSLTEEGQYILVKTWHEAMIKNAAELFKDHYSQPSSSQSFKNVAGKVRKASTKRKPGEPIRNGELTPEYKVMKKTRSLHGLLLMKLLRSALNHQIKLEPDTLETAKKQATIFLNSLGLYEEAITPLILALRELPEERKLSRALRDSQQRYFAEMGEIGIDLDKKIVLALSLDGGGTRGLYTARLLEDIEARCNRNISEIFDIIAGTSTGGILALALNVPAAEPNPQRRPKYSAKDAVELYTNLAKTIFPQTHKVSQLFWTIYDTRYDANALESLLKKELGETNLDNTLKKVVIPAFDIKKDDIKIFKTRYAMRDQGKENPRLYDLARYTSAAPTYLSASERSKTEVYVDGGIVINNPSELAYEEAKEAYPNAEKIILISLGTTEALNPPKLPKGGIKSNLSIVLQGGLGAQSKKADKDLRSLSDKNPKTFTYIRVNVATEEPIDLANSDPKTLKKLLELADRTIESKAWNEMIEQLKDHIREDETLRGKENLRAARKDLRSSGSNLRSSREGLRSSRTFN